MSRHEQHSNAFTLVELLVVIAIISTLMGLLLPAIQSSREASRRIACLNNTYQMGRAVLAFDDKRGSLPGWRNRNVFDGSNLHTYGWPVLTLTQLERIDIYESAVSNNGVLPTESISAISFFACPSAPLNTSDESSLAYVGNAGYFGSNSNRADGVLFDRTTISSPAGRSISMDAVATGDGTTNTLLFAERSGVRATLAQWPADQATVNLPNSSLASSQVFVLTGTASGGQVINASSTLSNVPAPVSGGRRELTPEEMLSSNHPGGVDVVFCDGHTQFLRDSIAPSVLSQLMTSKGAQATDPYHLIDVLREDQYK